MSAGAQMVANVLVCAGGNRLRRAEVFFNERIRRIVLRDQTGADWSELRHRDQWQSYLAYGGAPPEPAPLPIVDGGGLLLIPGAVDAHVHFNTPGYEDREDIEHGSLAAICGGVTLVADMPCTSVPPVTSVPSLAGKIAALRGRSCVDYALWGGISAQMLRKPGDAEYAVQELAEGGVVGFKCYMTSGMSTFGDLDQDQLAHAARLAEKVNLPLAVHAEERTLVRERERIAKAAGRRDWRAYAESRDESVEATAIETLRIFARVTGCAIHIVHLSSRRGLDVVRAAQSEGLRVTAETCPHYLHFTQDDFDRSEIRDFLKTAPPVKSAADREALWHGLADGSIAFVTTDHAGCDPAKEKSSDDFWEVYGGIPGVEHRVPYLLSEGFMAGRITLERALEALCSAPARFLGADSRKGTLAEGMDADFSLVDLWSENRITAAAMHSKGKYTPFEGLKLRAGISRTWLRGRSANDGASGKGAYVERGGAR